MVNKDFHKCINLTDVVDNDIIIAVFAANRHARFSSISGSDVIVFSVSGFGVIVTGGLVVVVVRSVPRRPLHLVLFLEPAPGVGEPRRHLRKSHLGDDGEHDLLALGRVRVLDVFVQPGFERARRLACRVFTSYVQTTVTSPRTSLVFIYFYLRIHS